MTPFRVGDYVVHQVIGEGGMARVYRGEELLSHRPVAVKVLRTELATSEQIRQRFITEMRILANLDDPNIVRCLSCIEIEGRPAMVLELLDGWTLRTMLETRRALPWTEVVAYALQIAKALHAAHSQRPPIIHRDLKPENVMVLPDGRVKVMDFGIAKILRTMAGPTTVDIGTTPYMSPEHIDGQPLDGRSDLFALGILMWEMLAGTRPFAGKSPRELFEQICTHPAPALPPHVRQGLPPHVETLVFRLLAKQPAERPANAAEVIAALEPWTRPASVSAPQPSSPPPRPAPPPSMPPPAAVWPAQGLNTGDIVEDAREQSLGHRVGQQVDEIAGHINRFANATSALIVRIIVGLLVMPVGMVLFIGVPLLLIGIDVVLLDEAGVSVDRMTKGASVPRELPLLLATLLAIVFVRSCWAHRRPKSRWRGWWPWLGLGGLILLGTAGATAIEMAPQSTLGPSAHLYFSLVSFAWLSLTMSWITGRIASRLFRRLERPGRSR